MTLKDSYAFSLHTIKENKSRSILTIVISTFLSLLIMGLMCIVISFVNNGNKILNKVYFEDSIVSVEYSNYRANGNTNQKLFDKSVYPTYKGLLKDNEDLVSYVTYYVTANMRYNSIFTDPDYPVSTGIELIEGRNILPSSDIPEVLVSQNAYAQSMSYGDNPLSVGSVHEDNIYYSYQVGRRYFNKELPIKYKVVGVYSITGDKYMIDGQKDSAFEGYQIIADINLVLNYMTKEYSDFYISSSKIYYKNSIEGLNPKSVINRITKFNDDIEAAMPSAIIAMSKAGGGYDYDETSPMRCRLLSDLKSLNMYRLIFLIGGGVISIVLLLMSVGSLANSVMISIDRSKKFIGLLKALGVKGKELRRVIIFESVTLISLGVLIAYGLLWALSGPLSLISGALTNSIYGNYALLVNYTPTLNLPIYVFFGAIVLFVLLTLVFARGSLRKISKMDPMAVISEVS